MTTVTICLGKMLSIDLTYLLYYVPLIIAVSLVFGGTRHEDMNLVVRHGLHTARWISSFMGIIFVVLLVLDWLT